MPQRSSCLPRLGPLITLMVLIFIRCGSAYGQIDSISINTKTATCDKANGTMTIMAFGGTQPYSYSIAGGTPAIRITSPNNVFANITGGNYTVTVTDATGHDTTILAQVGDIKGPTLVNLIATQGATCANNDGVVEIFLIQGTPNFSYWVGADSVGDSSAEIGYARKVPSGIQTITIIDDNGCKASGSVNIPLDNNLTLAMSSGATICQGTTTPLYVTSNATSFSWAPATGLSSPTVEEPVAGPATTTTYTLTATLGICSQMGSAIVTVLPAPVANAGPPVSTCYGKSVQLQGSGGVSYQWSPARYLTSTISPDPTVLNPVSSVVYSLTVKDGNGCQSLKPATVVVTVKPPYRVEAGDDTSVVVGQTVQLRAVDVDNVGFDQYSWTPENGLSNPAIADPVATLTASGDYMYMVTATAADGCTGTDTITIKVFTRADIYVPNAFTPNHDGHNDLFRAIPVGVKEFRGLSVFDRWGNRVFMTTNASVGWDGTVNGRDMPMGTYVWVAVGVDYTGRVVERKGTVVLVR